MVGDPRHDHSFRIPRPDDSVRYGTPNACDDCHRDKTAAWAAHATETWYGSQARSGYQHFTRALAAARRQSVTAAGLYSTGQRARALTLLRQTREQFPGNREVVLGLASLALDAGDLAAAERCAHAFQAMAPADARGDQLLEQVRAARLAH